MLVFGGRRRFIIVGGGVFKFVRIFFAGIIVAGAGFTGVVRRKVGVGVAIVMVRRKVGGRQGRFENLNLQIFLNFIQRAIVAGVIFVGVIVAGAVFTGVVRRKRGVGVAIVMVRRKVRGRQGRFENLKLHRQG